MYLHFSTPSRRGQGLQKQPVLGYFKHTPCDAIPVEGIKQTILPDKLFGKRLHFSAPPLPFPSGGTANGDIVPSIVYAVHCENKQQNNRHISSIHVHASFLFQFLE